MYKWLNVYRKLSTVQRSAIWFTIANFFNAGLSSLSTIIFTRLLSSSDIGKYSVYYTWYSLFCTVITLNLAYGIYETILIEKEDDKDNLTSSLVFLTTIFCLCGLLIFFLFNHQITTITSLEDIYLYIMIIDIFSTLMCTFFETSKRFDYNYKVCVSFTICLAILRLVFSVVLVVLFPQNGLLARVIGMALPYFVAALILFVYFLKKGPLFCKVNYWKEAVKFNILLVPHYLSSTLLISSDRIMISRIISDSKAGIYSTCYSCAGLLGIFVGAVNAVFTPYTYRALKENRYDDLRNNTNTIATLTMIFAILLILFAPELITIFAPIEYREGINMMPILIAGSYMTFIYFLFSNIEFYYKKSVYVTIATIMGAIINLILNYYLLPICGYQIAAFTTLIGYICMALFHYIAYKKTIGFSLYDIKALLIKVVIIAFVSAIALLVYDYLFLRLLLLLLFFVVFRKKIIQSIFITLSLNKQ